MASRRQMNTQLYNLGKLFPARKAVVEYAQQILTFEISGDIETDALLYFELTNRPDLASQFWDESSLRQLLESLATDLKAAVQPVGSTPTRPNESDEEMMRYLVPEVEIIIVNSILAGYDLLDQ